MPNIIIETGGTTASVATDLAQLSGITTNFQIFKLGYGVTGSVTLVSSSNPLPVSVGATLSANITGFSGPMSVQGIASGTPLTITGTVLASGITGSPVYVKTFTGSQVEVTGGRYLSKTNDSVSVWGPNGITYIYANLVDQAGNSLSYSNGALNVNVIGATISVTIDPTVGVTNQSGTALRVQGFSGGTSIPTTVGNTVGINDTAILASMAGISNQLGTLNSNISSIAGVVPTGITGGRTTATTAVSQLDVGGYTCSNGVNIKSSTTNTDIIYINNTNISGSGIGYELDPGQAFFIKVNNTNKIYMKAKSGSQIISFLAS